MRLALRLTFAACLLLALALVAALVVLTLRGNVLACSVLFVLTYAVNLWR